MFKRVGEFLSAHKGKAAAAAGFLSGLLASKYPAISHMLEEVSKMLGGQ